MKPYRQFDSSELSHNQEEQKGYEEPSDNSYFFNQFDYSHNPSNESGLFEQLQGPHEQQYFDKTSINHIGPLSYDLIQQHTMQNLEQLPNNDQNQNIPQTPNNNRQNHLQQVMSHSSEYINNAQYSNNSSLFSSQQVYHSQVVNSSSSLMNDNKQKSLFDHYNQSPSNNYQQQEEQPLFQKDDIPEVTQLQKLFEFPLNQEKNQNDLQSTQPEQQLIQNHSKQPIQNTQKNYFQNNYNQYQPYPNPNFQHENHIPNQDCMTTQEYNQNHSFPESYNQNTSYFDGNLSTIDVDEIQQQQLQAQLLFSSELKYDKNNNFNNHFTFQNQQNNSIFADNQIQMLGQKLNLFQNGEYPQNQFDENNNNYYQGNGGQNNQSDQQNQLQAPESMIHQNQDQITEEQKQKQSDQNVSDLFFRNNLQGIQISDYFANSQQQPKQQSQLPRLVNVPTNCKDTKNLYNAVIDDMIIRLDSLKHMQLCSNQSQLLQEKQEKKLNNMVDFLNAVESCDAEVKGELNKQNIPDNMKRNEMKKFRTNCCRELSQILIGRAGAHCNPQTAKTIIKYMPVFQYLIFNPGRWKHESLVDNQQTALTQIIQSLEINNKN